MFSNRTVLPHGLLDANTQAAMAGFNKSYRNYALRIGVVLSCYDVNNKKNKSKLTNEYDLLVVEQHEDRGATTITYRNCMSAEGLGSIADFFEVALRVKKKKTTKGDSTNLKGQNGAIALMLCLDGMSDKGIIIGFLTHPDRKTTLKENEAHLEGEYNGLNVKINNDGSAVLTFKGATDNDGKAIDKEQGNTVITIEKDGSYQVQHKTVVQRFDKKGKVSLTADDDISNTTKKNFNINATENVNITAKKNLNANMQDLLIKAQGSATLECQKMDIKSKSDINIAGSNIKMEAESMANIKAPQITIDGMVSLGGSGGQPVLLIGTMMMGTGNLGIPVISTAISGFSTKVTAQ